jgi:hypothetical protein
VLTGVHDYRFGPAALFKRVVKRRNLHEVRPSSSDEVDSFHIRIEIVVIDSEAFEFLTFPKFAIEIEEGLTAFALSHHRAYGTVPGGSYSRDTRFVMIEEEKQTLLSKETV